MTQSVESRVPRIVWSVHVGRPGNDAAQSDFHDVATPSAAPTQKGPTTTFKMTKYSKLLKITKYSKLLNIQNYSIFKITKY